MLIKYDKKVDAKYITLFPKKRKKGVVVRTEKIQPWLLVDYDKEGNIFGVEVLNASKNLVTLVVSEESVECYPVPKSVTARETNVPSSEIFNEPAEELNLSLAKAAA